MSSSSRIIENQLTRVPFLRLKSLNFRRLCILQKKYDNYDYDAPESRWRRQGTLATSQIEEGICWFARTVLENQFVFQLPQHQWNAFSTSGLSAYRRSAPVSIRPGSIRPTSAPNAVDPPQLLGRSAPNFGSFRPDQTAPNLNWSRH